MHVGVRILYVCLCACVLVWRAAHTHASIYLFSVGKANYAVFFLFQFLSVFVNVVLWFLSQNNIFFIVCLLMT